MPASRRPAETRAPLDDLAWCSTAFGIEAGPTRLETMRRLVLYLAVQAPLVLKEPEKERKTRARTA